MKADVWDADSVAAIIVVDGDQFLLQHREDRIGIDFRGLWGLFGGAIELPEAQPEALRRELSEELRFQASSLERYAELSYDERDAGGLRCRRTYFLANVSQAEFRTFELNEGLAMRLFSIEELADVSHSVIPYDLCALFMYERTRANRKP